MDIHTHKVKKISIIHNDENKPYMELKNHKLMVLEISEENHKGEINKSEIDISFCNSEILRDLATQLSNYFFDLDSSEEWEKTKKEYNKPINQTQNHREKPQGKKIIGINDIPTITKRGNKASKNYFDTFESITKTKDLGNYPKRQEDL